MLFSYFDVGFATAKGFERGIATNVKALSGYRTKVSKVIAQHDNKHPEYSLVHAVDPAVHDVINSVRKDFSKIKHLVLIGIGGSNLGTEAVHQLLGEQKVQLHSLDTIAPYQVEELLKNLKRVKKAEQVAICVITKSGGTAETLINAGVILDELEAQLGKSIYKQTIFIGNPGTALQKAAKKMGARAIAMPEIIGGRYSVGTEVGLVPLALLGHDTDAFIEGLLDASKEQFESVSAENAARLYMYLSKKYTHYNFFAFEPRLYKLGAWYRQLQAESLGKTLTKKNKKATKGFVPTITTAVELHSTGQLHMSGLLPTYTDFVTFDDDNSNYDIPKKGLAKNYSKFNMQEVATGIYGGVIGAFQAKKLPYRATIFDDDLLYSVGLFMGMRMMETMYVAELLGINAFDQPNVELYKDKTREILGI
jgi:glucose-6-phosphate isomerase